MALSIAEYLVMQNAKSINLENEKKKLLGLPLKDFILSCHFNGIPCDFDELVWYKKNLSFFDQLLFSKIFIN